MSHQVEKEFKNLLTKDEYEQLLTVFELDGKEPVHQTNVYYDTADGQLRHQGMGLRIRIYDDFSEQTLKSPLGEHEMLETTDPLSLEEGNHLVRNGQLKLNGDVARLLKEKEIAIENIEPVGQLSTFRYIIPVPEGEFCLDASYYQDQNDYELEFETNDVEIGLPVFEKFLVKHGINRRKTLQKIARALNYPNK